jgi:tight adherence protein B
VTHGLGVALAALAAALGGAGAMCLVAAPVRRVAAHLAKVLGAVGRAIDEVLAPLRRAGAEGRDATRPERRRLQLTVAAVSLPLALAFAAPVLAACLAIASAALVPRALVCRRERYTRQLGEGTASAASRIADALASGHTTRAGLELAAGELEGPIGREFSRIAADIQLGASTDVALAAFRERAASRRVDLLVAAICLHRRSGGNLAALLREIAAALEDQARLEAEARAETAQARFTSSVVLAMPFCVLGLYELVSPGTIGRLVGSALGLWLLIAAALMQVTGAVLVRRLARIDP